MYVSRSWSNLPLRLPFQKYVTCPYFCVSLIASCVTPAWREVLAERALDLGARRGSAWQMQIAVVLHHAAVEDVGRAPRSKS